MGLAEEVMNITIFCKEEEDEERDAPVANCEEGMEEASAAAASLVVFFSFFLSFGFCFVPFPMLVVTKKRKQTPPRL